MILSTISKNGVTIRLTDERWSHITEEHCELAGMQLDVLESVAYPDRILMGGDGELLAAKEIAEGKLLVAVYREFEDDGFIVTAFLTRRTRSLDRRVQVWP